MNRCEQMEFPKTFDEFAEEYGFKDKEEVYTKTEAETMLNRIGLKAEYKEEFSDTYEKGSAVR